MDRRRVVRLLGPKFLRALRRPEAVGVSGAGAVAGYFVGIPVVGDVVVGGVMLVAGASVATLIWDEKPREKGPKILLRPGTPQQAMVAALRGYSVDLKQLRAESGQSGVGDLIVDAWVAVDLAVDLGLRVGTVLDKLDVAIERSSELGTAGGPEVAASTWRMQERRDALRGKLQSAVAGAGDAYSKVLEMSAAVDTMGSMSGSNNEMDRVNASLDALRAAVAELESDVGKHD